MGRLERVDRVIVAVGGSCPALERLDNGDLLVSYRDDTLSPYRISLTRSQDGGRTWTKESSFAFGRDPGDTAGFYSHNCMAQLSSGTILLPYFVQDKAAGSAVMLRKSTDRGHTWSDPILIAPSEGPTAGFVNTCPYGKIREFRDGSVIMPMMSRRKGERYGRCGYLVSRDKGESWSEYVTAAHGRHAGDENAFVQLPSGRILCVCRDPVNTQGHGVGPLYGTWSDDNGKSWAELEMVSWSDPRHGHSPSFFITKSGTVICAYRYVAEMDQLNIGGVGFCYVQEEGLAWHGETYVWGGVMLLSFMLGVDCMGSGYPSIAYADEERILMVHHNQQPPQVCKRDIEGVFYVEEGTGAAGSSSPTHVD